MPWSEIDLQSFPRKRADMLKASHSLTVPQIFFNDAHIGGASALKELHDSGRLDEVWASHTGVEGPTLPELQLPDYEPEPAPVASPRALESICVGSLCLDYAETLKGLRQRLEVKNRAYHGKTYNRCFVGNEFVTVLVESVEFGISSREEAVEVGQRLLETNVLAHVCHEHGFEDRHLFYRFHEDQEPHTLNSMRVWTDRVDDSEVIVASCKRLLGQIQSSHTDADGLVDYVAMGQDARFEEFRIAVCEFQKVDLPALDRDHRLSLIINIYNMAIVHAFVSLGIPQTTMERYAFFDLVGYDIGGHFYSFNSLENGVLRGNVTPPYHFRRCFRNGDPRLAAVLDPPEPRIHFALNCGAKSCPPVKKFTAVAIDEELRLCALAFFESDDACQVDLAQGTLWLTKILSWYSRDFGSSPVEIATTVLGFLQGDKHAALKALLEGTAAGRCTAKAKFRIRHFPYGASPRGAAAAACSALTRGAPADWGNNAKNFDTYSRQRQKATASACAVM